MKSYTQIIIKTSLKTVAFIICAIVMVSLFIFSLFPALAVDFYSMIGQKNKEYHYQTVLAKTDATWAYKSAQSSIELERSDEEKAQRIAHFLKMQDDTVTKRINEYNLSISPSKAYDVLLFSVENYMAVEYARIKGQVWTGDKFVTCNEAVVEMLSSSSMHDYAMMINALCEIEDFNYDLQVLNKTTTFVVSGLEELFLLRAVVSYVERANVDYEIWGKPVAQYYEEQMRIYINM